MNLMWDLFQSSGVPQYYALYAALKYDMEDKHQEESSEKEDKRKR